MFNNRLQGGLNNVLNDSDTDADAVDNNIFVWKSNKTTYSAGVVTNSQNNKTRSTSNGRMTSIHNGLPRNFERQQYMPHNRPRNMHSIRETASVTSRYNNEFYPPNDYNSQYGFRHRGYASEQLSPVSMRSASDAMSVCSRVSALDIVSALKTMDFSRQDDRIIRKAFNDYMRYSGKIRKRPFKRKKFKSGEESGDQASNSSMSSEDDCRSQSSYRRHMIHDRYSRNRSYCPKRQANSTTQSEIQFRSDNALLGQAMKDKTICTDRTNTLKQNIFSMRPWNHHRSTALNGIQRPKPLPIAEENYENEMMVAPLRTNISNLEKNVLVVQDKIKSPEKIISCSERSNLNDVLGLPKVPNGNSTLRNSTVCAQKEKPKDFVFLKPTLPFKGRSKKSGVNEPVNNNVDEEKEADVEEQSNDQYEMSQCSSDTLTKSSFMRRKLFTQTLDVTENKLNKSTNLITNSPLTNIYSSDTKGAKQRKSNITQPCLKRNIVEESNKSKQQNILELVQKIVPPEDIDTIKGRTTKSMPNVPKIDVSARIANYDLSNLSDSFTDEENFFVVKKKTTKKKSAASKNKLKQNPKPESPKSKEVNVPVIPKDLPQNISNITLKPIQSVSILQNRKFQFDFSKNQNQISTSNKFNSSFGTRNKCSNITRKVNTFWDTDASESELSHVDNTVLQNDIILQTTSETISKSQTTPLQDKDIILENTSKTISIPEKTTSKKTVNATPKASNNQTKIMKNITPVNNKKHFTRSSTGTSPDSNHENIAPIENAKRVMKKPPKQTKGEIKTKKTVVQKKNREQKVLSSTPIRTTRRSANITDLGRSPLITTKLDEVGDRSGNCQNDSYSMLGISVNNDSNSHANNSNNSNMVTRSSVHKAVAQHKSRECLHAQDNHSRKDEKGHRNVKKQTTVLVGCKHSATRRMSNIRNLSLLHKNINKVDKSAPKSKSGRRRSSIHVDGQDRQLNYWQRTLLDDGANKSFTFTRNTRNSINSALDSTLEMIYRCNDDFSMKRKLYRNRNNNSDIQNEPNKTSCAVKNVDTTSKSYNSTCKVVIEKLSHRELNSTIINNEAPTRRSSKRKIPSSSSNLPKMCKTGPSPSKYTNNKSNTLFKTNNFEHAHTNKMINKRYFTRSSFGDSFN